MFPTPDLNAARQRIEAAYRPELVRDAGHRLIDAMADYLVRVQACEGVVLPWRAPPDNVREAAGFLDKSKSPDAPCGELAEYFSQIVRTMLQRCHNLHDPRYIGHQVPAPVPLGGLFDAVGSLTNQVMAIYDMGPWSTAVECAMVDALGQRIGWPAGQFSGLVTHGGSIANLTALLTAHNVQLPGAWEAGIPSGGRPPVMLVQADAHYSVSRSAGVLGLGTNQVVRVGLDARRRMDPQQLDDCLRRLRADNQPIVAVTACACATPIGAFDPLDQIAEVCRRHEVWLHVDAAHGGSACLSARHRHLVRGLDQADSVIWDAHKMLFVPGLCAFVFYREGRHRFETFRQEAPYLFDPAAPGLAEYDSGLRTLECTKRAAAFGLWGVWSLFGERLFTDLVDVTFELGQVLYGKLQAAPDFTPLHDPQCNIVVFRYTPEYAQGFSAERLGQFQLALRRHLIESGQFYIVSTNIDRIGALRVTIINPLTTPDHLDQLLDAIRRSGEKVREATD